jgi:hypothetical protein
VRAGITADPLLSTRGKRGLLALYKEFDSECRADPEGAQGSATVAKLVIFGQPVNVSTAPNTTITIPGIGVLILNEQTTDKDGTITVNAVHLKLNGSLGKGDIILAQSRCGIDP